VLPAPNAIIILPFPGSIMIRVTVHRLWIRSASSLMPGSMRSTGMDEKPSLK
jgi:hypothetical protein